VCNRATEVATTENQLRATEVATTENLQMREQKQMIIAYGKELFAYTALGINALY
jgi:hypothetical protein